MEIKTEDNKYTFRTNATGGIDCDRYGEPWHVFEKGSNAILALMFLAEYKNDKELLDAVKNELHNLEETDVLELRLKTITAKELHEANKLGEEMA